MRSRDSENRINLALDALGISRQLIAQKQLPFHIEAQQLVIAEADENGKEYWLVSEAAEAWREMKQAARQDGVVVQIVSAFRSVERQIEIVQMKLARGMSVETILSLNAPPGYSEHHTGCAIDLNTPGCPATEEPFEDTDAFRWLTAHAGRFGFALSYPRGNPSGFMYEPWHWCFQPAISRGNREI
jgi:D-alanyl-D-alanine carboxypeptidase